MAKVSRLKALGKISRANRRATGGLTEAAHDVVLDTPPYWERAFQGYRSAMVVTSSHWLYQNKYIVLYVNPREMSWNMPKRESVSKTAAGSIRNAWRNRFRGTYYDEPTINITFQTGNLMPGSGIPTHLFGRRGIEYYTADNGSQIPRNIRYGENADAVAHLLQTPPVPPGLNNFYDFLSLVDQPMLGGGNGENRHILLYRTRVFPRMRLEGYFTGDPITFTESADNANTITWNATFMVYDSYPKFWSATALKVAFSDAIRSYGGMSEVVPRDFDLEEFQRYWEETRGEDLEDADLPYKTAKLDSQTGRKKKKAGLVATTPGKTATKAADKMILSNEAIASDNVFATKKILSSYEGANEPPGDYAGKTIAQTQYWPDIQQAIQDEFLAGRDPKDPPPSVSEVNEFAAMWMKQNMLPEDQARYGDLIRRLEGASGPSGVAGP